MVFSWFAHRRDCKAKKEERARRISDLPETYKTPLSEQDIKILTTPLDQLVGLIQKKEWTPLNVLHAYGRKALEAHKLTNCLTEVMIEDAEIQASKIDFDTRHGGSLAGVPVSLKDTVNVKGYDSCIGYSAWTFKPAVKDSKLVQLLKDAGAIPFVKTNVPTCLLSFESYNDVWGRTTNPHNTAYAPGGSTGGESALLAYGGSIIGVGTDVAGSVRIPAHFSGIYTIKCSTGRFPKAGNVSSMPGQEGVKAVYSPMTRSLDSLSYFLKAIIDMKPWKYDPSCDPLAWRDVTLGKKLRFGVLADDGVVTPSPACSRALELCLSALGEEGHDLVPFTPPSPLRGLELASQLLLADGGKVATSPFRWGEKNELGLNQMMRAFYTPNWIKYLWSLWYKWTGDNVFATLIRGWRKQTTAEYQGLVVQREKYKADFLQAWEDAHLDFLITVPNATPAVPHDALKDTFSNCGYTFLFNLIDYPAGVFPVTKVDAALDALPLNFKAKNRIEANTYKHYDAAKMAGLPVGVQVVGPRLEEERVLRAMEVVQGALHKAGVVYEMMA